MLELKRLALSGAALAGCLLMLGVTYPPPVRLVAHTSVLNQPIPTPTKLAPVVQTSNAPSQIINASQSVSVAQTPTGFIGSHGWLIAGNNCVVCVRELTGRGKAGNAGTWSASHSTPHVGDIMILRPFEQGAGALGHVMVVEGIDGSTVYTAGCNYSRTVFQDNGQYF